MVGINLNDWLSIEKNDSDKYKTMILSSSAALLAWPNLLKTDWLLLKVTLPLLKSIPGVETLPWEARQILTKHHQNWPWILLVASKAMVGDGAPLRLKVSLLLINTAPNASWESATT